MLEATADRENGFHFANTVLVSSTVSAAAVASHARKAKVVAPARHPSIQLSGSCPAAIRNLAASKNGCLLEATTTVPSGNEALDQPRLLTASRMILIVGRMPAIGASRGAALLTSVAADSAKPCVSNGLGAS